MGFPDSKRISTELENDGRGTEEDNKLKVRKRGRKTETERQRAPKARHIGRQRQASRGPEKQERQRKTEDMFLSIFELSGFRSSPTKPPPI